MNDTENTHIEEQPITETVEVSEQVKETTTTGKTFSQEEVNKIVTERLERERITIAKALGVEKYDKETIGTVYKSTQEQLEAERKAKAELETQLTQKQQESIAYQQGIRPEKIQEALTLAQLRVNEETTLEEAIQQVTEEYVNLTSVRARAGIEVGDRTTPKNPYITDALVRRYPYLAKKK